MRKQSIILIIGLLLCGTAIANFATIVTKMETYITTNEYTWQQIKGATAKQWKTHAINAGLDQAELQRFNRSRKVLRKAIIDKIKQNKVRAAATALLVHLRKAGSDDVIIPLMQEILNNLEVYGVDPNTVN